MKTFRIGGVHPAENKLSAGKAIETLALPKQAVFPLSQHIGAPATAIVKKGDVVKVGTKIAEAGGFVSAAIFSSVSGKVNKVDSIVDASGYRKPAIFIDVEGDEWEETIDRSTTLVKECNLKPEEIVAKIKDAGVVGMGGACFPTHVKLSPPPGCKAECVIINAVECEPYLTADHRLMLEKADEILVGVTILMKAVNVTLGHVNRLHEDSYPHQDFVCLFQHQLVIGSQVRFTFHRIDDDTLCLAARRRRKFHMGRETCTTHTYYTCILYLGYDFFRLQLTFFDQCSTAVNSFFPFITVHINKDSWFTITASIDNAIYLINFTGYRREDRCRYKTTCFSNLGTYLHYIALLHDSSSRSTDVLRQREYRLLRESKGFNGFAC